MSTQIERAKLLKNLHIKGDPLTLFNVWDAGSAKVVQASGAKVIATSSWAVAASRGYADGEQLPFNSVIVNLKQIIASSNLPVTLDFEGGYGQSTAELQSNIAKVIKAGAVGINFEDQIVGGEGLYSIEEQCDRIKAIRTTADEMSIPLFINARTDIFFKTNPANHNDSHLEEAISRADAYAKAGASGFFVPGLRDTTIIQKLTKLSLLPINIMITSDIPALKQLAAFGVARISYGPEPYRQMMDVLQEAGRKALLLDS
jgi:2-methylisocitrate lyase-like PEP mutase family enzyme